MDGSTSIAARDLRRLFELANASERELARLLGVHRADYRAISCLMQAGTLTVGELAAEVGASYATTTALVNRLEKAGHVQRTRAETDLRKVYLSVNPSTAETILHLMRAPVDTAVTYLEGRDETERAAIAGFTGTVTDALQHHLDHLTGLTPQSRETTATTPRTDEGATP